MSTNPPMRKITGLAITSTVVQKENFNVYCENILLFLCTNLLIEIQIRNILKSHYNIFDI